MRLHEINKNTINVFKDDVHMCVDLYTCECSDPGDQKRAQGPPEMELEALVG